MTLSAGDAVSCATLMIWPPNLGAARPFIRIVGFWKFPFALRKIPKVPKSCPASVSVSGGGSTIGPGKPTPPPCQIVDPVLEALELVFKAGPEGQAGPFKFGASLYKNVTSGEKGIKAELNATVFDGQVDSKLIPQNGSYRESAQEPEISVSVLGFTKNLTTGAPFESAAQKTLGIGLQFGVGFEVVVNRAKFDALSKANDACRAQGGQ